MNSLQPIQPALDETSGEVSGEMLAEQSRAVYSIGDQQMLRIRRIGIRMFDVANCVITFGDAVVNDDGVPQTRESIETAFCHGMPTSTELRVVSDMKTDPMRTGLSFALTSMWMGAPHIRFYASHPIHNDARKVVGSISLIDYAPRTFSAEDRAMFTDLAYLVEREIHSRAMTATQIALQKKNKNLRRKSLIDPLLGTWNRGAIMRILTVEAVRCDKLGVPLSLIVADLDYFKKINDTYGHPAGDSVLVKVASRLRSCIRQQEALGRYGGEEFLIVLPGSSYSTAFAVAERMRLAVASQPEMIGNTNLSLTVSAGVASTDMFPAATTDELISRADIALYAAKDAGRNCIVQAQTD